VEKQQKLEGSREARKPRSKEAKEDKKLDAGSP
jgi:hypothetical protein